MLESDGPGGAEKILLELAERLRERGHTIVPVGPDNGCGWLGEEFRCRGFRPETFSLRRPLDWRCLVGLVRMLLATGIDVVHSHEFTMGVYGTAAAMAVKRPHIITMHGGKSFAAKLRRRVALRWAARQSVMVAVSHATAQFLSDSLRVPAARLGVVPNGVSFVAGDGRLMREEFGLREGEAIIVSVGNLYPVKGYDVLIQALSLLQADRPDLTWRAMIAGRGHDEGRLRQLIERKELATRCLLLGHRDDIPDLLAAADVYALPSLSEGLPLALLEAMLAGKPIVASDVGGIPEAIGSNNVALLVTPGNAERLAEALATLLSDRDRAEQLGHKARTRARREFGARRMMERYEELYYRAIRSHASARDLP
jgi:glycosyltransferase involved in cell wall biosynthesis